MREWCKYLNRQSKSRFLPKDRDFNDHKRSMGGYKCGDEYKSKEGFFSVHLYSSYRYKIYDEYLRQNLKKSEQGLSIGSGRCANELKLIEENYNIICSDLDEPCREERLKIFPELEFVEFDITTSPFRYKVNYIICLSMFYLFDDEELCRVFENVSESLKTGGKFIFDFGGGEDNILSYFIDEVICKYEAILIYFIKRFLKGEKFFVTKKHHGYRRENREIISIAEKAGFKFQEMKCNDYVTEMKRSVLISRLIPDRIIELFGRFNPYIRIFNFVKSV